MYRLPRYTERERDLLPGQTNCACLTNDRCFVAIQLATQLGDCDKLRVRMLVARITCQCLNLCDTHMSILVDVLVFVNLY